MRSSPGRAPDMPLTREKFKRLGFTLLVEGGLIRIVPKQDRRPVPVARKPPGLAQPVISAGAFETLEFRLPRTQTTHSERMAQVLVALRPGDRVAFARTEGGVLTNLVAHSRK